MRIRINAQVITKEIPQKTHYAHEIYSMILNQLKPKTAQILHEKKKFYRLFSFTPIFFHDQTVHWYITGADTLIEEWIQNICRSPIIRLGDMVVDVKRITPLDKLPSKDGYVFKTNVVINNAVNGKSVLADDFSAIEERLKKNAIKKGQELEIEGDISFQILNPTRHCEPYKEGHIYSWKCLLVVKGDYELVRAIYDVGCGENTATGHGFLWEVA